MDPFTTSDVPLLRKAVQFLRRTERGMPGPADSGTRQGVLMAALALDEQADTLPAGPVAGAGGARRPLFNALVAPLAGGPVVHADAAVMLDAYREESRAAAEAEFLRAQGALLALHPKTANPRHGCCAPPKLCRGHRPECRSSEHAIGGEVPWPCKSLRAVGIRSDDDARAVRAALAALEQATDPDGYPSRMKTSRGRGVHATRQCADGIGDIAACAMHFGLSQESSVEDPCAEVSCQACVKALFRKRQAAAAADDEEAGRCTLPPHRRLLCGCCTHQVCESCGECGHACRCGDPAE
ncbi:hypothetical protein ABZ804_22430 [Streptomyces sp. NPDC047726]|uniref:hypothetical protein n=1 Tax=unclassified Streptomyces TaxID=2593676 RepID=UPI0033C26A4E